MSLSYRKAEITLPNGKKFPAGIYINPAAPVDAAVFIWGSGSGESWSKDENPTNIAAAFERLQNHSSQKALLLNAEKYGYHVMVPLFVQAFNNWIPAWTGGTYINACIDWAVKNMPISPKRVLLVGWSEGGCMVKDAVTRNNELSAKIAGGVVLAGGGVTDPKWELVASNHMPLYFYHAKDDNSAAPYSMSTSAVDAINKFKPDPAPVFVQYQSGGHSAALKGLEDPLMYQAAMKWSSDYEPVEQPGEPEPEPPVKTVVATIDLPGYGQIIAYSDKTAIVKP